MYADMYKCIQIYTDTYRRQPTPHSSPVDCPVCALIHIDVHTLIHLNTHGSHWPVAIVRQRSATGMCTNAHKRMRINTPSSTPSLSHSHSPSLSLSPLSLSLSSRMRINTH